MLDFLIQTGNRIIPIEVKAEENPKAKSLAAFVNSYPTLHAVRLSMSDYREQDWMTNLPLYAVGNIRLVTPSSHQPCRKEEEMGSNE